MAEHAGISTAYVFKLFPRKQALFVAAFAVMRMTGVIGSCSRAALRMSRPVTALRVMIGAAMACPDASAAIHECVLAIKARIPVDVEEDDVPEALERREMG